MRLLFSLMSTQSKVFPVSNLLHVMLLVFVSWMLCMSSFVSSHVTTSARSCIEEERQALLSFKAHLDDPYNKLQSWESGEKEEKRDCCKWYGVRCNNDTGHVIGLDLSSYPDGLAGNITPSLPLLHQLQYLVLRGIDFQSNSIPPFLSSFAHLEYLDLSNANLSGPIPHQLGNLSNLLILDLSRNDLSGNLPNSLGQVSNLRSLDVSSNSLEGGISDAHFVNLPHLKNLFLSRNQLTGIIPNSLWNSSSLFHLDLSYNLFSGSLLSTNQLTDIIPNSLWNSSSLFLLDLSYNLFNGLLPNFVVCPSPSELYLDHNSLNGSIPDFSRCKNLNHLSISHNRLSGNLPESLGQVSSLQFLDLSSNSLEGEISDAHFVNLTLLRYLDLSFNSIAFELSPHWKSPSNLWFLKLQSCKLGPSFPIWLRGIANYSVLDISNSRISDRIPAWFWERTHTLAFLNLSSNDLRGMLPNRTSNFGIGRVNNYQHGIDLSYNHLEGRVPLLPSRLATLNLSGNRFSGTLSFLCQFDDGVLNFLDLSNNLFSGNLPDCWSRFKANLVVLNLSNNSLFGDIPSSMGYLSHLEALYLRSNAFVGELPISMSNCTKLKFLDLGENKLFGNIPTWIGERLSDLSFLILRSNRFYGSLPSQVCWLNNLYLLDISSNGISRSIPRCFGNFTAMVRGGFGDRINHIYSFDTTYKDNIVTWNGNAVFTDNALVAWKGMERKFERNLELLKIIDLSCNKLSGKIPYEITSLHALYSLNLSMNNLHGELPQQMGQMKSLESLDLSRNEFSGNIPMSLSQISFLSVLDLSYNNFSGRIPIGSQLQLFNSSSYTGNPYLCGPPLTPRCGFPPATAVVKVVDDEDEDDVWKSYYIGISVGFVVGFWGICGAIFFNRGCRYFVFSSLIHAKDWLYLIVVVNFHKIQRKFTRD